MAAKQPGSIERALRRQPPWTGDRSVEPLLLKLVPRREPWASEQDQFRNYVWAEVQRIARDAQLPPPTPARLGRKLAHEHAQARKRADALTVDDPGYQEAQYAALFARWGSRIQKIDRHGRRAAIKAELGELPPNRSGGSARLIGLLTFIRAVTGRPHFANLARLLALAGWRVQPDALRMAVTKKTKE